MIQIRDQFFYALMRRVLQQVPVETAGFRPFTALREFLPHEKKLLAGMRVLICEKQAEVCILLPHIARHLVEKGVFSVNDFVMGKGQHEILGEGVDEGKGDLVVLVFAVDGIGRKILERVIHPAHVPFETEAEAAEIGGA